MARKLGAYEKKIIVGNSGDEHTYEIVERVENSDVCNTNTAETAPTNIVVNRETDKCEPNIYSVPENFGPEASEETYYSAAAPVHDTEYDSPTPTNDETEYYSTTPTNDRMGRYSTTPTNDGMEYDSTTPTNDRVGRYSTISYNDDTTYYSSAPTYRDESIA